VQAGTKAHNAAAALKSLIQSGLPLYTQKLFCVTKVLNNDGRCNQNLCAPFLTLKIILSSFWPSLSTTQSLAVYCQFLM